jgi:hypothetical protein
MRSKAPFWTGESSCVLSLGDLLIEMSHFSNVMSTQYALVFGYSWPLSSCYSLERVCPSGLLSASSAFANFYISHWCSVGPSAPVHSCHMTSPFPLKTDSRCHSVLCVGSLSYFSILHSVAPHSMQFSVFHLPLTTLEHLFLLHEWRSASQDRLWSI